MNNKKIGNQMEKKVAEYFAGEGYWVHRLQDNHNGQPFDMIAIRENKAYCMECKHCIGNVFNLSRLEFNQKNAFEKLSKNGSENLYIAIQFGDDEYFYTMLYEFYKKLLKSGVTSVKKEFLDMRFLADEDNIFKYYYDTVS